VADRLLDRKANSLHNLRRIADAQRVIAEANLKRRCAEEFDKLMLKALTGKPT